MGEIVLCVDRDIRRPVALKRMLAATAGDPSRRARFIEEALVTGQLEHPNIVPVHELTRRDDGSVYFTMKLVKGKSLADIIRDIRDHKDHRDTEGNNIGGTGILPVGHRLEACATAPGQPSLGDLLQVFLEVCDGA
ncbi:MAG: hypothetical protein FJ290_09535 [Planctomycetes bacterium]|nr:hypothetical protein [Planctomycetota bacterium]